MCSSSWESGVVNSTGLCSTRAGVGVDVPGGVAVDAGVHGVTSCGGGGEDLIAAEIVAGERGAEVKWRLGHWGRHAQWKRTAYSLEVDVLDGEVVVRRSRAVILH
jgi:hypothetical protein